MSGGWPRSELIRPIRIWRATSPSLSSLRIKIYMRSLSSNRVAVTELLEKALPLLVTSQSKIDVEAKS